jgi:hypothetical protein
MGSVDASSSSQFKFFMHPSEMTPQDVDYCINVAMNDIERLDVGLRIKIKDMIRQDLDNFNLKKTHDKKDIYATERSRDDDSSLTYGEMKSLIEQTFGRYGPQDAYRSDKEPAGKKYKPSGGYK